jgi:hypothetical protein
MELAALHAELYASATDEEARKREPLSFLMTAFYACVATVGVTYFVLNVVHHWSLLKGLAAGLGLLASSLPPLIKQRPDRRRLLLGVMVGAALGLAIMLGRWPF